MNVMFDHQYISSFTLFLDNQILSQGSSFTNYSGLFYPVNSYLYGYTAYNCGFRQIVNDISISGANVMSGVYVNGQYTTIGGSYGLASINHSLGNIYFTGNLLPQNPIISGNFAIKDFNISITDEQEYDMLFNTEFQIDQGGI